MILALLKQALSHPWLRRLAAALALLLTLNAAAAVFWLLPAWRASHAAEAGEKNERDFEARKKLLAAIETAELKIADAEKRLASDIGQAELARLIHALAAKNRLKLLNASYRDEAAQAGLQVWQQDLALEGSYASLRNFLRGLDALPGLNAVSESRLQRTSRGIKASLKITTWKPS